jgi:cobalt transporter subunit CbtB
MAAITTDAPAGAHIAIPTWVWFTTALALFAVYVVFQENGLVTSHWATVHELFHDGRHALGFPCH